MRYERIVLNAERNVTLDAYVQDVKGEYRYVAARPAILVIPGGGYQFCSDREAEPIAFPSENILSGRIPLRTMTARTNISFRGLRSGMSSGTRLQ